MILDYDNKYVEEKLQNKGSTTSLLEAMLFLCVRLHIGVDVLNDVIILELTARVNGKRVVENRNPI